jgi:hypothetical protein
MSHSHQEAVASSAGAAAACEEFRDLMCFSNAPEIASAEARLAFDSNFESQGTSQKLQ